MRISIKGAENLLNPAEVRGFIRYMVEHDTSVDYGAASDIRYIIAKHAKIGDFYLAELIVKSDDMYPPVWSYVKWYCQLLKRSTYGEIADVLTQYKGADVYRGYGDIDEYINNVRESNLVF